VTVGDGTDYSAVVSGLISKASGTFTDVSSGISEKGDVGGSGSQVSNSFSLQLNSQFFAGSPACARSSDPSDCQAWQQFVYTYNGGNTGDVYMQYWLIDYDATCPSGWDSYSEDCYTNSNATETSGITAAELASVDLTASAVSGGNDAVSLSVGSGRRSPSPARTPRSASPPPGTRPSGACTATAEAARPLRQRRHAGGADGPDGHRLRGAELRRGGLHRRDEQPQADRHPRARHRVLAHDGLRADRRHRRNRELRRRLTTSSTVATGTPASPIAMTSTSTSPLRTATMSPLTPTPSEVAVTPNAYVASP
jgi:hypothetical protein